MGIRLDDEARRLLAVFDAMTDGHATDCLVDDETVVFVVPPEHMAAAIGPDGRTVRQLEERIDRQVVLIEAADRAEDFIANAFAPAAVYEVEVENDRAVAAVDEADLGVAIGSNGARINRVRRLAARHFDIEAVEIEGVSSDSANEDA